MSKNHQAILSKDVIKHERSAPYSPHQNGTAEQNGCTLFDMARCVLIENQIPKRAVDLCSTDCIYGEEQVFSQPHKADTLFHANWKTTKPDKNAKGLVSVLCLKTKHTKTRFKG